MQRAKLARVIIAFVATVAGFALIIRVKAVLPPFLVAGIIVYLFEPCVRFLKARGFRRSGAVLLIFTVAFLMGAVLVLGVLPSVLLELTRFLDVAPELAIALRDFVEIANKTYASVELPAPIRGLVDESIVNLEASAMTLVRNLLEGTLVLLANLPALLLAPVIAYYVLRDFDVLKSRTYDMMPNGRTGALAQLLRDIDAALNGFIRGQFILGVVVGALVAVFTTLVGLKFGLLLGILAAFGEFIPYFGPFLAAIPAVGFALIRSPVLAAKVALGYVLIQQVESLFLAPKVIGTNVGIHPVAVVFVLLVGATLFGFLGLLLSVPLVVVGRLLLRFVLDNYAPRIS